jgi:hypothetical protein
VTDRPISGILTRVNKPRFDAWPDEDSAWLLHPSFGLARGIQPLPLEERQLPTDFTSLAEDEQGRRIRTTAATAFTWALAEGADHVRVSTYQQADQQGLLSGGFDRVNRNDFLAIASSQSMNLAAGVHIFDRIWVTRGESVTLYVHETWDSVVVADTEDAVERLRGQLPAF